MRLYTREELLHVDALLKELLGTILHIMEQNTETIMPGFHTPAEGTADHACTSHGCLF